jgi:hypothetical protein
MTTTRMPGFSADESLYTTSTRYYGAPDYFHVGKGQGVIPQLPFLCELCHYYCTFFANRLDCYVFCGRAGFCGPTFEVQQGPIFGRQ